VLGVDTNRKTYTIPIAIVQQLNSRCYSEDTENKGAKHGTLEGVLNVCDATQKTCSKICREKIN
jgi:hypothetical protein